MDRPLGDSDAPDFAEFYRHELDGQVRRAALLLGSESVANDAVHDAFVSLYRRWADISEPGPYLNRSVLNRCRDIGRRDARKRNALPRMRVDSAQPDHDVLWDVLSGLPFNQRAAIVLRFYVGMTEAEIAASLGCAPGSVGPWISRALATMRKELT